MSYDADKKVLKIKAGYLSRNGNFASVESAEIAPKTGLVCLYSELQSSGEWTEPEFKIAEPNKYTYPIGQCNVEGSGDTQSVSVCSFRVPVVILIDAATCPLSTEYEG